MAYWNDIKKIVSEAGLPSSIPAPAGWVIIEEEYCEKPQFLLMKEEDRKKVLGKSGGKAPLYNEWLSEDRKKILCRLEGPEIPVHWDTELVELMKVRVIPHVQGVDALHSYQGSSKDGMAIEAAAGLNPMILGELAEEVIPYIPEWARFCEGVSAEDTADEGSWPVSRMGYRSEVMEWRREFAAILTATIPEGDKK